MKKISFIFESCKESIRITYLGFLCVAIGFLVQNEGINIFYTFKSTAVLVGAEFLFKFGECIIVNLPLIFMLNIVCKKSHSASPVMFAILGYFAFVITTVIFGPVGLDSNAYINNSFISTVFNEALDGKLPLNTGMIGPFIVAFITRYTFIRSRHNGMAYKNSNFDKDIFGILYNIVLCFAAGLLISFAYPFVFEQTQNLFNYIKTDFKDPVRMGIFGILDRVFSILGMPNIIKNPFYFSSLGGSYTANNGMIITGDVGIWEFTKDLSEGYVGAGRFIAPYYVINIFMIPFIYFGLFKSITNKHEKNKFRIIFIFASILSIVCGNPLPLELLLLFTSPILLLFYLLLVGATFASTTYFEIFLGSNISSMSPWVTMPGSLPDYLINLRNVYHFDAVKSIAVVGFIIAIFALLMTMTYYKFIAADPSILNIKSGFIKELYDAVGGKDNIKDCSSGLFRIMLTINDFSLIDMEKIKKIKVSKIFETKEGINVDVGSSAYLIAKTINENVNGKKKKDNSKKKKSNE